jgi:PAS domain-containing protein
MTEPSSLIGIVLVANLGAGVLFLLALAGLDLLKRRKTARIRVEEGDLVFLFRDEDVVDASPLAQRQLNAITQPGSDWQKFLILHAGDFPDLAGEMAQLVGREQISLEAANGRRIQATWCDGLARISVFEPATGDGDGRLSRSIAIAAQREAHLLRDTLNSLPALVWHEDAQGTILWANDAYLARASRISSPDRQQLWPPERLFALKTAEIGPDGETRRATVQGAEGDAWFDVHIQPVDGRFILTATSAERVVQVEQSRRDFVQTLTKTFGQLNFGLAVFDKQRRMGLFNPALTQLTRLDIEFLAARPTLAAFLDQLRERRVIPEPRDYAAWRAEITDAALTPGRGGYESNWLLASGQTYRVCGRCHVDGSFALTFEDVSKEVSLTRRHRAEIELAQGALDAIDDPVAAFSETGALALTNRAFDRMWGVDPSAVLGQMTILDLMRVWQSKALPSQVWGELRDLIAGHEPRSEWSGTATLLDGQVLSVRVQPSIGGSTMVIFSPRDVPVVNFESARGAMSLPVN